MGDEKKIKTEIYEKHDEAWEKYKQSYGKKYSSKYHENER